MTDYLSMTYAELIACWQAKRSGCSTGVPYIQDESRGTWWPCGFIDDTHPYAPRLCPACQAARLSTTAPRIIDQQEGDQ